MKHLTIFAFVWIFSLTSFSQENIQEQNTTPCNSLCQSKEACIKIISQKIAMNWSKPPVKESENTQVALKIFLLPNGSLQSVSIETSTGHEKLDGSVLQAVKRASNFCEIQGLSHQVYEENFKELVVVFNTQDSRN